ncbi:MAG: CDP-alcohol phosphatidyltransferase family protein [candidate division WOR-3 bacterium]
MQEAVRQRGRLLLRPILGLLAKVRVPPTLVTMLSLPTSAISGWLFAIGSFKWAGVVAAVAGLCDSLDGELARMTGRSSAAGAFLDSVSDRLAETFVFAGMFWYYQARSGALGLLVLLALSLSLMVSYVRARAEGLGRDCRVGLFERPVRVIVVVSGALLLGPKLMPWALLVIAAGGLATVFQRVVYVLRQIG